MSKKSVLLFVTCLILVCPVLSGAQSLYYILDGSGSMWGRIDGKMKIDAARDVLTQLIREMPSDIDSGLTVYGHRKKGDCNDISELVPLGKRDRDHMLTLIRDIKPMGKTPIAESLKKAAQSLKGYDDTVTLVLISDGIETCGGDPCKVAEELAASGLALVLHVVGFDVDKTASAQLKCIAGAGGGRYFPASTAEDLLKALASVQKSVIEKTAVDEPEPEPEPEKIKQTVSGSSTSIRIKAKGPGRISFKHHPWLKPPKYWKLIDPETGEEKGRFSGLAITMVPEGEYQIVWHQYEHGGSPVSLAEVVRVRSGKTVEVPLLTAIKLNLPDWVKPPRYWGLKNPETGETVVVFNRFEPFLVPAGTYDLIWRQSEHGAMEIALKSVTILPDVLNHVSVATAIDPSPADWVPDRLHYWGLKKIDHGIADKWSAWFRDDLTPQLVPPGTYAFFIDLSEHGSSDSLLGTVDITGDAMTRFTINTGVGFIPPKELSPPYFVEFIELDAQGNEKNRVRLNRSFGPMPLKPGTYRIDYRQEEHGSSTMTIVDSFDLPEGAFVEIEL